MPAFSHCFATKVTATTIVDSFIPSSPLNFLTVSAIPSCLCDTLLKFGNLVGDYGYPHSVGDLEAFASEQIPLNWSSS